MSHHGIAIVDHTKQVILGRARAYSSPDCGRQVKGREMVLTDLELWSDAMELAHNAMERPPGTDEWLDLTDREHPIFILECWFSEDTLHLTWEHLGVWFGDHHNARMEANCQRITEATAHYVLRRPRDLAPVPEGIPESMFTMDRSRFVELFSQALSLLPESAPTGKVDFEWLDALRCVADKGVPVSLRTWASAANLDLDTELLQMDEDVRIRQRIQAAVKPLDLENEA